MIVVLVSATLVLLFGMKAGAVSMPFILSECDNYINVQYVWYMCLNNTYRHYSVFSKPLLYAQDICRDQEKKNECMRGAFSKCDNIDVIIDALGGTFDFCRGSEVDNVFTNYLENDYQKLSVACEAAILGNNKNCNTPVIEPWDAYTTLQDGMMHVYRWEASLEMCFGDFIDRPSVPECGMASGLKAFTDFLAIKSLQNTVGSIIYEKIHLLVIFTVLGWINVVFSAK